VTSLGKGQKKLGRGGVARLQGRKILRDGRWAARWAGLVPDDGCAGIDMRPSPQLQLAAMIRVAHREGAPTRDCDYLIGDDNGPIAQPPLRNSCLIMGPCFDMHTNDCRRGIVKLTLILMQKGKPHRSACVAKRVDISLGRYAWSVMHGDFPCCGREQSEGPETCRSPCPWSFLKCRTIRGSQYRLGEQGANSSSFSCLVAIFPQVIDMIDKTGHVLNPHSMQPLMDSREEKNSFHLSRIVISLASHE
jgi:hypothetical protein